MRVTSTINTDTAMQLIIIHCTLSYLYVCVCVCVYVRMCVCMWVFLPPLEARFVNGYCSRVGGKVRGCAKLCTCLMGNVWLITWRSFADHACYH